MNENFSQQKYNNRENAGYNWDVSDLLDCDEDICSTSELETLFKHKYKIHDETSVTSDNSYVLRLAKDDSFTCIVAGLSDGSVRLFEVRSEKGLYIQPPTTDKRLNICGVRFVDETPNLLLVGTTNGLVRLLDLRTRKQVARFENNPDNEFEPKHIVSFDSNSTGRCICMAKLMYRYQESHKDDVTSLRFHPINPYLLCSGSTDSLINIFDLKTSGEDDAILSTINTESTVHKVNWHENPNGKDIMSCITHTNCFKAYEFDGDIIADFDRLKITEGIKRKNEANCDLIDCHRTINNGMMLMACSSLNDGATLRSCVLQDGQLKPYANFKGNTQIVRESIFDAKTNIFVTAGERGLVTIWTPLDWDTLITNTSSSISDSLKIKTKKSNKFTPY